MYKVMIMLEWIGEFRTFQEAFEKLYWEVKKQVEEGKPLLILMETNGIVYEKFNDAAGYWSRRAMKFEDARDFAYKMKYLINEGELVKPAVKIPEELVTLEFFKF